MELNLHHLCESENYSKREGSPSVNLCLGIGAGPRRSVEERRRPVFTAQQLNELNHQALVFKYIISGLTVPAHLILPIWKSVSCSSACPYLGIFHQSPSSLGFNHPHSSQRTAMDPEPARCRRTDGKRWRCSKNALDDQKYCERHMNRGYQRSRKHVEEASRKILESSKSTAVTYLKYANVDTENEGKTVVMDQKNSRNNTVYIKENESGLQSAGSVNIRTYGSYDGGKSKIAKFSASLQGATGLNCKNASSGSMSPADTESKRCKRTDGKKWRCKHEAVTDEKYCARHIHRGVRKKKLPLAIVTVAAPPPPPAAVAMYENTTINLNTRLSMSVAETCSNDGSSSSDATTITDENASYTRVPVLFPSH